MKLVSILALALVFVFPVSAFSWDVEDFEVKPTTKRAWDPRPAEVVLAEGMVKGRKVRTLHYMRCVENASAKLLAATGDDIETVAHLGEFREKIGELAANLEVILKNREYGNTMTPQYPIMLVLQEMINRANEPMFKLLKILASHHITFECVLPDSAGSET